jgi:hypothetical protein
MTRTEIDDLKDMILELRAKTWELAYRAAALHMAWQYLPATTTMRLEKEYAAARDKRNALEERIFAILDGLANGGEATE